MSVTPEPYQNPLINEIGAAGIRLILQIGEKHIRGVTSKHRGGWRYYELNDGLRNKIDISIHHEKLSRLGVVTREGILKYRKGGRGRQEQHYLIDLTKLGWATYFNARSKMRYGLSTEDLSALDEMFSSDRIKLSDVDRDVLGRYMDFLDLNEISGINLSGFASEIVEQSDLPRMRELYLAFKEARESAPLKPSSNLGAIVTEEYLEKIRKEIFDRPEPRKNYILSGLLFLRQYLTEIGVAASVIGAVITLIGFMNG